MQLVYMDATGRGELSQLMKSYIKAKDLEQDDDAEDKILIDSIMKESMMTAQERIIKYLKAMRQHLVGIDHQIWKDLNYCIQAVTKGELSSVELQKSTIIK